jgi:hypothetical protein
MPILGSVFHEIEFDQDLGNVRLESVTNYLWQRVWSSTLLNR